MQETEIMMKALQWRAEGRAIAVAIVTKTWGSAPQASGARLIADKNGAFFGSVSGGCIEASVITTAAEVIASKQAQTLTFGVSDETAWDIGLSCGGDIEILLHPLLDDNAAVERAVRNAIDNRQSGVRLTRFSDGAQRTLGDNRTGGGDFPAAVMDWAREQESARRPPQILSHDGTRYFAETFSPPPRLLIIGATHITQSLLTFAQTLGFQCIVIDPRTAWATTARFPDADIRRAWPDDALADLSVNRWDALLALTHDPKIDDPALLTALAAKPFYIGALGSHRTHKKRLARLRDAGADEAADIRIHAPIGLDIGAMNATEIALSIMAQVVQVFRRENAR